MSCLIAFRSVRYGGAMRLSIRSKLILSVGLPLLVIYGGVIGVDYYRSRAVALAEMRRQLRNQARAQATRLEYALRNVSRVADQLGDQVASNENVPQEFYWLILRRALDRNRSIVAACVAFEPGTGPGEVYQFAPLVERQSQRPEDIELYRRFGMGPPPAESSRSERTDYFETGWYRQAIAAEKGIWSEPYHDGQGRLVSTYAEPMFRDGQILGVVAVDVRIEWLRKIIKRHRLRDGKMLLVSRNGRFIQHPQETFVMTDTLGREATIPLGVLAREMTDGGEEARRMETPEGVEWAVFTPVPSAGWSYAALLPEKTILQPVRHSIEGEVAILLVAMGLLMLVMLVMSLTLTRPITRLTRAMRHVEMGNRHAKALGRAGNDEIGDLMRAFNRMTDRLGKEEKTGD